MSEFGNIVAPYRVAPAQGGLADLMQFLGFQQEIAQQQEAQRLAQGTRGHLAQQQGLPENVDPFALQKYAGENITQRVNSETADRAQQEWQQKLQFAQNFTQGLPQQSDPYLGALQGVGPNIFAADALNSAMGGQFDRSGELENRRLINQDDNTAAAARLAMELKNKADIVKQELDLKNQAAQDVSSQIAAAYRKGASTGDWSDYHGLTGGKISVEEQMTIQDMMKQRKQEEADALKRQQIIDSLNQPNPEKESRDKKLRTEKPLPPQVPNQFFDPRIMEPRRQGDDVLQQQLTNIGNFIGFIPRTMYYGGKDLGYKGAQLIDWLRQNYRF